MINLEVLSKLKLNEDQMKKVRGGQEQAVTMNCRNQGGFIITLNVTQQNYEMQIDNYNESPGAGGALIGCDNPWAED